MLEGSVLVHLLNFIIIQSFCLCDLSWIYLESSLSFHTDFKVSATFRVTQGEETCTMAVSTVEGMSPFPRLAGLMAMSPQGGINEVTISGSFHVLGHWQVQENLCLTLMFLIFFEQDRVGVFGLWFFLFKHQGFSHLSAVPCHSYHLGEVLICQRIRTTEKKNGL